MAAARDDGRPRDDTGTPAPPALPDDLVFCTAAAPGLDEDDLFVALVSGAGPVWGDGRPWPACGPDEPWSEERERRRRHERLMRCWAVRPDEAAPDS